MLMETKWPRSQNDSEPLFAMGGITMRTTPGRKQHAGSDSNSVRLPIAFVPAHGAEMAAPWRHPGSTPKGIGRVRELPRRIGEARALSLGGRGYGAIIFVSEYWR